MRASRSREYLAMDRIMAKFAPAGLLALPAVWMLLVLGGFTAIFWSIGERPWQSAFMHSGSSLFTLGNLVPRQASHATAAMAEAGLGLGFLALLISYLPSIYACYSRRELLVTGLEVEAGSPPSAAALLERLVQINGLDLLDAHWDEWRRWFNDIEETHSTSPVLVFFRSPSPERSWVTAAGAVLDSASLVASTFDIAGKRQAAAELCLRSGYLALRRIGDLFAMPYDPDPRPEVPIAVTRQEYDAVCQRLADAGAVLKPDRDQTWRDFVGWRVCYEAPLLQFASLCMAPSAPWSGDRPIAFHRLPLSRRQARLHAPQTAPGHPEISSAARPRFRHPPTRLDR
jgi:hypothetical protein